MKSEEVDKDIYDVDAWIDEGIGAPGTEKRKKAEELAIAEFNAQLLLDARKEAKVTQAELAKRVGVDKAYISRVERGLTVPSMTTFSKIAAALGFSVTLTPIYG